MGREKVREGERHKVKSSPKHSLTEKRNAREKGERKRDGEREKEPSDKAERGSPSWSRNLYKSHDCSEREREPRERGEEPASGPSVECCCVCLVDRKSVV